MSHSIPLADRPDVQTDDSSTHESLSTAVIPSGQSKPLYQRRSLKPISAQSVDAALQSDATARRILAKCLYPQVGDLVGVRLNLSVKRNTGVAVHSIHQGSKSGGHRLGKGFYRGTVLTYLQCVTLHDVFFNVSQKGRQSIASGLESKFPMASCDGTFCEQPAEHSFDGVICIFNPRSHHLFVDSEGFAVRSAEEATIFGHVIYARGLRYFSEEHAPPRAGDAPSTVKFRLDARPVSSEAFTPSLF